MSHITQDQAYAIAIQNEATHHQANQFWILTNSELVNVCNAAIQHYIETCINQLTGIAGIAPVQKHISPLDAALTQPDPVQPTDDHIRQIAESVADDMWPEVGYVGWTDEDKEFYGRFARAILEAAKGGAL